MEIDDKIRDKKVQYDITKEVAEKHYYQVKLVNVNTLQVKKYFSPSKVK